MENVIEPFWIDSGPATDMAWSRWQLHRSKRTMEPTMSIPMLPAVVIPVLKTGPLLGHVTSSEQFEMEMPGYQLPIIIDTVLLVKFKTELKAVK